ncbi:hypothetical protein BH09ACT6_BH09ACT6_03580 [soil metagenome]
MVKCNGALPNLHTGIMDAEHERSAVDHVAKRLTQKYPEMSPEHINAVVQETYQSLLDKPLRDYIPNLVEHLSKAQLRAERPKKSDRR